MTNKEVLQLALDALKATQPAWAQNPEISRYHAFAIARVEAALASPKQKPRGYEWISPGGRCFLTYDSEWNKNMLQLLGVPPEDATNYVKYPLYAATVDDSEPYWKGFAGWRACYEELGDAARAVCEADDLCAGEYDFNTAAHYRKTIEVLRSKLPK